MREARTMSKRLRPHEEKDVPAEYTDVEVIARLGEVLLRLSPTFTVGLEPGWAERIALGLTMAAAEARKQRRNLQGGITQ